MCAEAEGLLAEIKLSRPFSDICCVHSSLAQLVQPASAQIMYVYAAQARRPATVSPSLPAAAAANLFQRVASALHVLSFCRMAVRQRQPIVSSNIAPGIAQAQLSMFPRSFPLLTPYLPSDSFDGFTSPFLFLSFFLFPFPFLFFLFFPKYKREKKTF